MKISLEGNSMQDFYHFLISWDIFQLSDQIWKRFPTSNLLLHPGFINAGGRPAEDAMPEAQSLQCFRMVQPFPAICSSDSRNFVSVISWEMNSKQSIIIQSCKDSDNAMVMCAKPYSALIFNHAVVDVRPTVISFTGTLMHPTHDATWIIRDRDFSWHYS